MTDDLFPHLTQVRREGLIGRNPSQARAYRESQEPDQGTRHATWPWRSLEVGQSFFAPGRTSTTMRQSVGFWNVRLAPKRFVARNYEHEGVKGVMVWRVE